MFYAYFAQNFHFFTAKRNKTQQKRKVIFTMPRNWRQKGALCVRRWKNTESYIIVILTNHHESPKDRLTWLPDKGYGHANLEYLRKNTVAIRPNHKKARELIARYSAINNNFRVVWKLFTRAESTPI